MYVCVFVAHPSEVEQPLPSQQKCSEGEWAQRRPGEVPLGEKAKKKKRKRSQVAPGPRVSAARARAALSPGRVSPRAPVGAVLAATLRRFLLGVVPGAPLACHRRPVPATTPNGATDRAGRGLGRHVLGAGGRVPSAWFVPSAKQPMRSKTKTRQSPLPGPFPLTVLPPGGLQEPSRVRSCSPSEAPGRQERCPATG